MIRIWVYDGILASGVSAPVDVFTAANHLGKVGPAARRLAWRIESVDGRPVRSGSGQMIEVDGKIDGRASADAILLTAPFVADMEAFMACGALVQTLGAALRQQHQRGTVIATYCTGSYLLAEAGLLDGRIATTHWAKAADFARRYPRVALRADQVLTEQEGVLCGGAVTSFLDVALRLVERFAGADLAAATAKTLLIDANRVTQAPYASLVEEHGHGDRLVMRAQRHMEAALRQRFSLPDLANHLAVSERTLSRRFKQAVGATPLEYVQSLRIELAKRLLETGSDSFDEVSRRVGYEDAATFRQLFKRRTGLSPREYRQRFARAGA